jgi:hypothetical protein
MSPQSTAREDREWKLKIIFKMKYSVHNTQAEAESENERLEGLLGIPNGTTTIYGVPEERDGKWLLRVKEKGTWKADHLALNVQEIEESE